MKKFIAIVLLFSLAGCLNTQPERQLNQIGKTVKKITDIPAKGLHSALRCQSELKLMEYAVLDALPGSLFFYEGPSSLQSKAFKIPSLCEAKQLILPRIKSFIQEKNDTLKCDLSLIDLVDAILKCEQGE